MSGVEIREVVRRLQQEGMEFLRSSCLVVNGVEVYPKEIEVYYYKVGEFEDYTVHQNELQTNNRNRFYVHRRGEERESSRIEGSRGGCDFVVSDKAGVYYSYLLRSVVIDGELAVGPRNSLDFIMEKTGLTYEEFERVEVEVRRVAVCRDVLTSLRIGLGDAKNTYERFYKDRAELRLIVCDEYFKTRDTKGRGYPKRTEAMDGYLKRKLEVGEMSMREAAEFSRKWYATVPGWLKKLLAEGREQAMVGRCV